MHLFKLLSVRKEREHVGKPCHTQGTSKRAMQKSIAARSYRARLGKPFSLCKDRHLQERIHRIHSHRKNFTELSRDRVDKHIRPQWHVRATSTLIVDVPCWERPEAHRAGKE